MNQDNNSEKTIMYDRNNEVIVPVGDNLEKPETPSIESLTPQPASVTPNITTKSISTYEVNQNVNEQIQEIENLEIKKNTENNNEDSMHETLTNNEELIKEYIGPNAHKIMKRRFNFAVFFFNSSYMFYRKMYGWGILFCILNVVVSLFNIYASIVVFLISGFVTNTLYLKHVNKKIDRIKMTNPGAHFDTILFACKRNGGPSTRKAILGLILQAIIFIIISIIFITFGITNSIFKKLNIKFEFNLKETMENIRLENIKIPKEDTIYDGSTAYVIDIKVDDVFTYVIPEEFTMYNHSNGFTYDYKDKEKNTLCSVDLRPPIGYSNSEAMIKQMRDFDMPHAKLSQLKINGLTWTTFEDDFGYITYVYGTMVNNQAWLLKYTIENSENLTVCNTFKDQIINNIKAK